VLPLQDPGRTPLPGEGRPRSGPHLPVPQPVLPTAPQGHGSDHWFLAR